MSIFKVKNLSLCALVLSSTATFAQTSAPNYRIRVWNLTSVDSGSIPILTITRDPQSGRYVQNGKLDSRTKSAVDFLENPDGRGLTFQLTADGQNWRHSYPDAAKGTQIPGQTKCEIQSFSDGTDTWIAEFDDRSAPDDSRKSCDQTVNYSLMPDAKLVKSAEQKIQNLAFGPRKSHRPINNAREIPIVPMRDGNKCAVSPDSIAQALHDYLLAQYTVQSQNPQVATAQKDPAEDSNIRFARCFDRFQHRMGNIDVVLEKGPQKFLNVEGWPQVGDDYDPSVRSKHFEVSCEMKTVTIRSLDTSNFFDNLESSLAGVPMPGIETSIMADDAIYAANQAHMANYRAGLLNGFIFRDRRQVVVPRDQYDNLCGDPNSQLEYAAKFIPDLINGTRVGEGVSVVTTVATGVAGGVRMGLAKAAAREAARLGAEETAADLAIPKMLSLSQSIGKVSPNIRAAAILGSAAITDGVLIAGSGPRMETRTYEKTVLEVPRDLQKILNPPPKPAPKNENAGGSHPHVNAKPAPKVPAAHKAVVVAQVKPKLDEPPKMVSMAALTKGANGMPSIGPVPNGPAVGGGIGKGNGSGNGSGDGIGDGAGVYSLGVTRPPKMLVSPTIAYTPEARAARVEGVISVTATVDENGKVIPSSVKIGMTQLYTSDKDGNKSPTSNDYGLKQNAVATMANAQFSAGTKDGVASKMTITLSIHCSLPR